MYRTLSQQLHVDYLFKMLPRSNTVRCRTLFAQGSLSCAVLSYYVAHAECSPINCSFVNNNAEWFKLLLRMICPFYWQTNQSLFFADSERSRQGFASSSSTRKQRRIRTLLWRLPSWKSYDKLERTCSTFQIWRNNIKHWIQVSGWWQTCSVWCCCVDV